MAMKKFLVLNGPNINMLGIREPGVYGTGSYKDLETLVRKTARELKVQVTLKQSNSENVGLFSCLGGQVYNLGLEGGTIRGKYAGAIAGMVAGGVKAASFRQDKKTLTLMIDKKAAPEFGEYLMSALPEIYASFKKTRQ